MRRKQPAVTSRREPVRLQHLTARESPGAGEASAYESRIETKDETTEYEEWRMLLVPRQLQRSGMTGAVPYYGGRLTPAHAWAASHPSATSLPPGVPSNEAILGRAPVPQAPPPRPVAPASTSANSIAALQQLLRSGVISQQEHQQLLARVPR